MAGGRPLSLLAELVIALLGLLEAEAREFRRGVVRLAAGLLLVGLSGVLVLGGLVLLMWSFYLFIGRFLEPPGTALVSGVVVFLLAGVVLWLARRLSR